MLKNEKSANRNDHQNRKTEVFCNKNRKTDLKNSQNRKTENPNAPLWKRKRCHPKLDFRWFWQAAHFSTINPINKPAMNYQRGPSRQEFVCKFADWFSSVFQSHCRVFCNLAYSSRVKTNQEIMIFTAPQKTTHTRSYSGPGNSEKIKETKVI